LDIEKEMRKDKSNRKAATQKTMIRLNKTAPIVNHVFVQYNFLRAAYTTTVFK